MRFSLKWILAATVYVAIAAAAFGRGEWYYTDALWALALLAFVYAILVTAFARSRRRIVAAGFLVASLCFLVCLTFGGDAVPTARLLLAAGYENDAGTVWLSSQPATTNSATIISGTLLVNNIQPVSVAIGPQFATRLRTTNAVATLAFGLMGSLVGLLAIRAAGREV